MFFLCPSVQGQIKDELSVTATIGWGGVVPGDRWAPMTVYITTGDTPAEGFIVASFPQDPTQSAEISVPFAATPNRTTPVTLVAALPSRLDHLTLTVEMRNRRIPLEFSTSGSRDTIPLPSVLDESEAVILTVGRTTLPEALKDWGSLSGMKLRRPAEDPAILPPVWGQMTGARAEPQELPTSWAAYQGLAAMVVPGDAVRTVDRAALAAVHDWVLGGGRLVIVADGPGEQWRQWLPEPARSLVQADSPATHPLPEAVTSAVTRLAQDLADPAAARLRVEAQRRKRPQSPFYTPATPSSDDLKPSTLPVVAPALQANGRTLRLSDDARRTGWALRWTDKEDPASGLLAEGPVGFGHVTILGLEPTRATEIVQTRASGAVWRDALAPALADFLATAPWQDSSNQARYYYRSSVSQTAITTILEHMAHLPGLGLWVVGAFGVGLVFLVALVGPVDYFVLKRLRAGQHWWLTALGWTTLASALAWAAPSLIRTSPTQVGRTSIIDCLLTSGDGTPGPALTAWSTGVTSVYAGQSGLIRPRIDPASWWHGAAAGSFGFSTETMGRGTAPTLQQAAGGAAGSARGNPLQPFGMALWTFRSFLDDCRADVNLGARVSLQDNSGHILLTGLPEGARVASALVCCGDSAYTCRSGSLAGGAWQAQLERGSLDTAVWAPKTGPDYQVPYQPSQPFFPGTALALPGASSRTLAANRLIATGAWAEVLLYTENWPPEPQLDRAAAYEHTRIFRLLVPLETPLPPAPPSDAAPPT